MAEQIYLSHRRRSPFPKQLAVSLEGRTDPETLSGKKLGTLELPSFLRARQELEFYLSDYMPDKSGTGTTLGVKGAFGSGKTHLCEQMMSLATKTVVLQPK